MRSGIIGLLDARWGVAAASAITLGLGLFFAFVWAPHPWGWQGIDQYHELARALARGEPFGTTDVPWGYAYYVAAWYVIFGEQPWLPVLGQVVLNASVPLLLFLLVRPAVGARVATLAALLAGVFSFNTIYASTQASDAICTVLFLSTLLAFSRGARASATWLFVIAGLLAGLVPQFRPNMVLFPLGLAVIYVGLRPRRPRAALHASVFLALFVTALFPWIVRNYRLTGVFLPTSTHGAVQLWYGSLQVGPYLENHSLNPRSVFEWPAFDYTSLANTSVIIEAEAPVCGNWDDASVEVVYWTDRNSQPLRVAPKERRGDSFVFEIPGQPSPTAIYYLFNAEWRAAEGTVGHRTWNREPFVYFVSDDHLGDLDRHGDVLDVFDIVRLMRHLAWNEILPRPEQLDLNEDGDAGLEDLEMASLLLLHPEGTAPQASSPEGFDVTTNTAVLSFEDGSSVTVHRDRFNKLTDLDVQGERAGWLVASHHRITNPSPLARGAEFDDCRHVTEPRANDVFHRSELHKMGRYSALALDNISEDPLAFALASVYRMGRLFIIRGSNEPSATYQFSRSHLIYTGGMLLSALYLATFLAGVLVAWRSHRGLLILLLPIAYIPLTIAFVLTNMRYSVTVQPLMFAFTAVAVSSALRLDESPDARAPRVPLI